MQFVLIGAVRLLIQLSLNILFVVYLGYGALGVLYSSLIASIILSVYLSISSIRYSGLSFSVTIFKELVHYGMPLLFSHLGAFILTFSDRYFIKAYFDLKEVGLYSLGYKFGIIVTILLGPFFTQWAIEMFEIDKREDREKIFVNIFNFIFILFLGVIYVESIYIKEAIKIIAAPEYLMSYTVVPIICLAYYFSMLVYYVRAGIMITKVTRYFAYSTAIAVAVNIGLNFLLIPYYGMYGAAISTLISFYVRFITVYKWSQKVYPIPYKWFRLNGLMAYSTILLLVSYLIDFENIILALLKDTAFLLVFVVSIFIFWLNDSERQKVKELLKNPRNAVKSIINQT